MENVPVQINGKWVIVYLIYADFVNEETQQSKSVINVELLQTLDSLCEDILKSKLFENRISVYAIFSTLNYKKNSKGVSSTFLFQIKEGVNNKNVILCQEFESVKKTEKEITISKVEDLGKIFKEINEREKNTEYKILLNTFDHGSVFGIFKNNQTKIEKMIEWSTVVNESYCFYLKEFAKAVQAVIKNNAKEGTMEFSDIRELVNSKKEFRLQGNKLYEFPVEDKKSGINITKLLMQMSLENGVEYKVELLSNKELAESIKMGFETKKIDVVVMMNCWMMNIDTMCWLKDSVDILIAPQTGIEFPAYNYKSIMECFYDSAKKGEVLLPESLTDSIIDTIKDETGKRAATREAIGRWAIFAVKLSSEDKLSRSTLIDLLVEKINEFAGYLLTVITTTEKDALKRKNLIEFCTRLAYNFDVEAGYQQYDLLHVLSNIGKFHDGLLFDRLKMSEFERDLSNYIQAITLRSHKGDRWNNNQIYNNCNVTPTALSIYWPVSAFRKSDIFSDIILQEIDQSSSAGFFNACKNWLLLMDEVVR
ncbi:hypothetical protein [Ferruginibacter sp.]